MSSTNAVGGSADQTGRLRGDARVIGVASRVCLLRHLSLARTDLTLYDSGNSPPKDAV